MFIDRNPAGNEDDHDQTHSLEIRCNSRCIFKLMNTEHPVLLFDGVCNLCNKAVQFVIRHDKVSHFRFAALQSSAGNYLLTHHGINTENFQSFVYLKGGKVYEKSSALLHVLKDLGGIWKLFYVFMIVPKPLRDFLYKQVAKRRYVLFGRRGSCMIPTAELRGRFLS